MVIPRADEFVFGTTRTRVGEIREREPCSWRSFHARASNDGGAGCLPDAATPAHASSAMAWRPSRAAVNGRASPLRIAAKGVSRFWVTTAQCSLTSSGSRPSDASSAPLHACPALRT